MLLSYLHNYIISNKLLIPTAGRNGELTLMGLSMSGYFHRMKSNPAILHRINILSTKLEYSMSI